MPRLPPHLKHLRSVNYYEDMLRGHQHKLNNLITEKESVVTRTMKKKQEMVEKIETEIKIMRNALQQNLAKEDNKLELNLRNYRDGEKRIRDQIDAVYRKIDLAEQKETYQE